MRDEDGAGLTDEELRDQLVTLLLAGHETTATALAWSLHELGKDPAQEAKARDAATSGDDDYLEAVLKESMRRAPGDPDGGAPPDGAGDGRRHRPAEGRQRRGLDHPRPRVGGQPPGPHPFRPERFLDGEVATNTWIPFGGGVRRCIGAGFSLMEGVAVLREVLLDLRRGAARRAPPRSPKVRNITSVPRHGARIVVTRR